MCENKEQQVVRKLLLYLRNEKLTLGTRLPSERALSEELNVSRSTLRVALKNLQVNGLLESKARSGYFLKSKNIPLVLLNNNHADYKKQVSESLEAFYLFEPVAVALATDRMDEKTLGLLEECLVDLSKAILNPDVDEIIKSHKAFHEIITSATGNSFIINTLQRFETVYALVSDMMSQVNSDQRNNIFVLHVNLFNAIKRKSSVQAAQASQKMIRSISALLSKYEDVEQPQAIIDSQDVLA